MMLSLVTFTYNDHAFVRDLLCQAGAWNVPVGEAVVVDDASKTPFSFAEEAQFPVRVVRLDENVGPGMAKHHGVSSASGKIILIMDADIRSHVRWLGHALGVLAGNDVGMVGATIRPRAGKSSFGKAFHRTFLVDREDDEAAFLPGGCLLFRRTVWDALGGVQHYREEGWAHEDVYLSAKMKSAGFRLIRADTYPVYEIRELHRTAYCRRDVSYVGTAVAAVVERRGVERYLADMQPEWEKARDYMIQTGDPVLVYVTFLKVVLNLVKAGDHPGKLFNAQDVLAGAACMVQTFPCTANFLGDDLARLGYSMPPARPFGPFASLEPYLAAALPVLENEWVERYRKEDTEVRLDAHYLEEKQEGLA